jgi:hypothetical protein
MSRSTWACRGCGQPLGKRHHTGRLHPLPGVAVYLDPKGRFGPFARLVCPVCDRHRDYADGPIVVRAGPGNGTAVEP